MQYQFTTGITTGAAIWTELLTALLVFVLGFATGYFAGICIREATQVQIRHAIAIVIAFAWFVSLLASVLDPGYQTPIAVHGMMGAVVGYLFQLDDGSIPFPNFSQ